MRLFGLAVAALLVLFSFRLLTMAFQSALKSQVMVRDGLRWKWQPVPPNKPGSELFAMASWAFCCWCWPW